MPEDFDHLAKPLEAFQIDGHALIEPWCVRMARTVATISRNPPHPIGSDRQLWLRTRDRLRWKTPESCVLGR